MQDSKFVKTHVPCLDCDSSDGRSIREDGSSFCFVCSTNFKLEEDANNMYEPQQQVYSRETVEEVKAYSSFALKSRGISQQVVDHFQVKMSVNSEGKPLAHYYPYMKDGRVVAYKTRTLPKVFSAIGDMKDTELFGQSQCGGGKTLVVTEGELDAMAMAQANLEKYNRIFPVVSLPNGAQSLKALLLNRDYLNQFESVILMFDMDEAGQASISEAARMVGIGKVKIAKLPEKDPCDVLQKKGAAELINCMWNAQQWSPAGVLIGEAIWERFQERKNIKSVPYPDCLSGLNDKLEGIRHGEITLFTSGTGSGKSTVIKEIILDLLENTDERVGLISLEESVGDTAEKLISMSLKKSTLGPPPISDKELREGFDRVFADERLVLLDHQGSVSDDSLLDKIEYMALMGCKYLVLDHITIAVSEGNGKLSGNEAVDKLMSDLLKIVKQNNVWLGLISHLRKSQGKSFEEGELPSIDDIKGSGSIKQISFDIIAFARNLIAEEEYERNTIKLRVLKSRFTGRTGDAGAASFNPKTSRLSEAGSGFEMEFEGL